MSVHVGEIDSRVDVQGIPVATPGDGAVKPSRWEERDRLRRAAEADRRRCERTAGEGFDG
jgi:hypothetical protein